MDMINLKNQLSSILDSIDKNKKPYLFLHVCCGPCSTYVLDYLSQYFNIYIIFYNPNIDTFTEFDKRLNECYKILKLKNYPFQIIYDNYYHDEYINYIDGLENEKEGGRRCLKCFELRLSKTKEIATEFIKNNNLSNNINYFTTTLTISPHKDAKIIYEIAKNFEDDNLKYLPADFKKNDGYLKSIIMSKELDLYRQNYCGCEFSKN